MTDPIVKTGPGGDYVREWPERSDSVTGRPKSDRPACVVCGTPLASMTYPVSADKSEELPKPGDVHPTGGEVKQVNCIRQTGDTWTARVWCGHFGHNGDDLFCSQRCGYKAGVLAIKEKHHG